MSALPLPFSCTAIAERDDTTRLVLAGELDLAERARLESALSDAQHKSMRVVLDLRELTLIDCASLHVIVTAADRSRHGDAALILQQPRGQVRRILDLTGPRLGVTVLDQSDLPDAPCAVAA